MSWKENDDTANIIGTCAIACFMSFQSIDKKMHVLFQHLQNLCLKYETKDIIFYCET